MILFGCVVAANGGDDNDIMFGVSWLLVRIKFRGLSSVYFLLKRKKWLANDVVVVLCRSISR